MNLSYSNLACPEWTFENSVEAVRTYGVDGLEIRLFDGDVVTPALSVSSRRRGEQAIRHSGVKVAALDTSLTVTSPDREKLLADLAVMAEIARVLKPGGRFAPTVPTAWPERLCWALAPGEGGYADQPGGHVRIFKEAVLRDRVVAEGFAYGGKHPAHGLHAPFWWLKCALWARRDDHPLIRLYHRFLVWDLMEKPAVTRVLDDITSPFMGKSLALHFRKVSA